MSVTIRAASDGDLQAIVEIFNQAIRTRSSTGYLSEVTLTGRKNWFTEHTPGKYPILVAEQNHRVIGYASVDPYRKGRKAFEKTGEVSLFIHQDYRRKGIGNHLLISMEQTAKDLGYTTLFAIVLDKNIGSRRLLEKNNFEQWGFLPDVALIDGTLLSHVYYGKKIC